MDNENNEHTSSQRILGFFLFPLAIFPALALLTYNWHSISALNVPPLASANLVGAAGDWFAYTCYQLVGLGAWAVPLVCIFAGLRLCFGHSFNPGRRTIAGLLFVFSATCLLQLTGHLPAISAQLRALNIAPNAGGAVGHLAMTRCLARYLSPFGAGIIMAVLMVYSAFLAIGLRNIVNLLGRITAWAADSGSAGDRDPLAGATAGDSPALSPELDLKAQREAEKQRAAEEKARIRAEKEAAREALRLERERALAEKEAARAAREAERQRLREQQQAELQAMREEAAGGVTDWLPPRTEPAAPVAPAPAAAPAAAAPAPAMRPMRTVAPAAPAAPAVAMPPQNAVPAAVTAADIVAAAPAVDKGPYLLPPVTLLNDPPAASGSAEDTSAMAQRLIDTLHVFDINAQLAYYVAGPVVTQYALSLDLGTRVEKVASLQKNIQMALQATSLRIEAPIPGKNAVGIEVPNSKPASIFFRQIIDSEIWQKNSSGKFQLPLLLGKDAAGNDLVVDLAKLPHLLIAGATGQGKSVCLNSIINGLLMCRTPEQLKFIMVDPKRVEFTSYVSLPHLLVPIINDTKKVVFALRAALVEMDKRLKMFARAGCRNIVDFNNRQTISQPDMFGGQDELIGDASTPRSVPYIVIVIDEVADIMQAAKKEVEPLIARLTALARATGIHLILATQRPSADVITGVIKGNIPGRIAFKTSSSIDSRTILDATGSELLIGKGDMLFKMSDGRLLRAQGSWITDEEIGRIVEFIGEHSSVQFDEKLTKRMERIKEASPEDDLEEEGEEESGSVAPPTDVPARPTSSGMPAPAGMTQTKEDQLYHDALVVLRDTKRVSISHLQRKMGIGYNHAARIVDLLEDRGVIGQPKPGAGQRDILLDPEVIIAQLENDAAGAEPGAGAPSAELDAELQALPPADDPFGFPSEN